MTNVVRLPKQHKQLPHCEGCGRPLPTFEHASFSIVTSGEQEGVDAKLEAITFHVRCACGLTWDLRRGIK